LTADLCSQGADDAPGFVDFGDDALVAGDDCFTRLGELDIFSEAVEQLAVE